jgi:hypothetical protein
VSRRPEARNRRLICGWDPASAPTLVPAGQAVTFENAQIAVPPGRRFGVWLRIIRLPDGLGSREAFFDVMRT